MKTTLFQTLFFCAWSTLSFAQQPDKAELECFYKLSFLKDTTATVTTDDLMVLRLNKDKSLFYSESSYTLDSLLCSDQGQAIQMDILANGTNKYGRRIMSYNILKDFVKKEIDHTDNVGGEYYRYQEALPDFRWQITHEQKQIWDFTCQKAVCTFRGRTYEAWFTSEIPVADGPWKFHGLPGLILEVYDTQKHYSFTFVGLQKSEAEIKLLPHNYIETSKEKYLRAYRNYIKNPVAFITASSGMTIKANRPSKRKPKASQSNNYEPMERE